MPKGGHVNSGPPPDPNALRQNKTQDRNGWVTLPAEGRAGDPPQWPLLGLTLREQTLWGELWAKPQAVMWEQQDQQYEVAMFVRTLALAENPDSSVERQKLVRQYFDSLGLSTQGLMRHRWKIAPSDEAAESAPAAGGETAPARPPRKSARSRLSVVGEGDQ